MEGRARGQTQWDASAHTHTAARARTEGCEQPGGFTCRGVAAPLGIWDEVHHFPGQLASCPLAEYRNSALPILPGFSKILNKQQNSSCSKIFFRITDLLYLMMQKIPTSKLYRICQGQKEVRVGTRAQVSLCLHTVGCVLECSP